MTQNSSPDGVDQEQPFISHLLELRDRLLRMLLAVLLVFLILFPFANTLYTALAGPLMSQLPEGSSMIAIEVASPFLTPFKLTLVGAIFLSMPLILYQFWAFVAPGLYRHERRMVVPLLISSSVLFYLGMAFAYFVVFPLVFAFFTSTAPEGVAVMTDISRYLDFVLTLFFAFGVAFEVPIATILLVRMGVTTPEQLKHKRPYIIVGAFVVGMLLTPPDVISQSLLALPMWLLFELGVYFSRMFMPGEDEAEAAPIAAGSSTAGAAAFVEDPPYTPPSDAEMEAELDRIEAEEAGDVAPADEDWDHFPEDPEVAARAWSEVAAAKLEAAKRHIADGNAADARTLLREVLAEGDGEQVHEARLLLNQVL